VLRRALRRAPRGTVRWKRAALENALALARRDRDLVDVLAMEVGDTHARQLKQLLRTIDSPARGYHAVRDTVPCGL
jgi:electron transfer flavoprotein alpha/beta subunit